MKNDVIAPEFTYPIASTRDLLEHTLSNPQIGLSVLTMS